MTAIDAIAQRLELQRRRNPSMGGPDSRDRRNAEDVLDGLAAHGFAVVPAAEARAEIERLSAELERVIQATDAVQREALAAWAKDRDEIERLRAEVATLMDGMERAWGIIANGRAWDPVHHDEWEAAKFAWRDDHWHPSLARNVSGDAPEQGDDR